MERASKGSYKMSNNVISFPPKPKEPKESKILLDASEFAYEEVSRVIEKIKVGDKLNGINTLPHVLMMFESIRSFYMLSKGEYHPAQRIAEEMFADVTTDDYS
jgi:hypothetical protein